MSKLVYIASPFSKIWDKEFAVLLAKKACDEKAKKWVKDESNEAKSRWYQADYEKARIEK